MKRLILTSGHERKGANTNDIVISTAISLVILIVKDNYQLIGGYIQ